MKPHQKITDFANEIDAKKIVFSFNQPSSVLAEICIYFFLILKNSIHRKINIFVQKKLFCVSELATTNLCHCYFQTNISLKEANKNPQI